MICEIINPSDPYTLETDNFVTAALAICLLYEGKLGLMEIGGENRSPVLFGWVEWFQERGIIHDDSYTDYFNDHVHEIADILDSVLIGGVSDRENVKEMLARTPTAERSEWLEGYHDKKRTSLNDIGRAAWAAADRLRNKKRQHGEREP